MINSFSEEEKNRIHGRLTKITKTLMQHSIPDTKLINDAFQFALSKHGDARRRTKEPYIEHPLSVAQILVDLGFESDMVAAALLHDVVEDCGVTVEELADRFGRSVADLVDALSAVNVLTDRDTEMGKEDVDTLSDIKLLKAIEQNPKALYIKLADRIHNLETISVFSYTKQMQKVEHTRKILIPLAKKNGVFQLVDKLEDLCFSIENPDCYKVVSDKYETLLYDNRYAIEECKDSLADIFFGSNRDDSRKSELSKFIVSFSFRQRFKNHIFQEITAHVKNILTELEENISKDKLALFDLFFIVKDECAISPLDVFFNFYQDIIEGPNRLTITAILQDQERQGICYQLEDVYNIKYHLYIMKQQDYLNKMHGIILNGSSDDANKLIKINMADPSESFRKYINVYKKDGTMAQIEEGATVLDFAFSIHPEIGICTKYALLNKKPDQIPLFTKLNEGDLVEIVHDANKEHPELDIPHATIRWFEYVRTREATKALSRYFETHIESAKPLIPVHDGEKRTYEIETGSTVLDLAFLMGDKIGLHFKSAYINKSTTKAKLDRMLRYDDIVRIEYDESDEDTPKFEWLNIVKTKKAKETLINYFSSQFQKKS